MSDSQNPCSCYSAPLLSCTMLLCLIGVNVLKVHASSDDVSPLPIPLQQERTHLLGVGKGYREGFKEEVARKGKTNTI